MEGTPLTFPPRVIGLTGLAGAGKDTFCEIAIKIFKKAGINAKRFALADQLKAELRPFILEHYNIDVLDCKREEKELIRPFLVFHGKMKRESSNGTYWTKIVADLIAKDSCEVAIITDIRYDVFERDEANWLIEDLVGTLIHIKRHSVVEGVKVYGAPPNQDERENDPKLERAASLKVDWVTGDVATVCVPKVENIIKSLYL